MCDSNTLFLLCIQDYVAKIVLLMITIVFVQDLAKIDFLFIEGHIILIWRILFKSQLFLFPRVSDYNITGTYTVLLKFLIYLQIGNLKNRLRNLGEYYLLLELFRLYEK